ncbi:MAG TPA: hypothetical protein VGR53_01160 [Nitrososphaerales archaeon]|nr:hypothetical protein [Nitrososphaerales archaeon]
MKPGWGIGTVIAIILSVAVYLLGVVDLRGLVSLILLLCGLWTVVSAFVIVDRKDRSYYSGWGVVIAVLSLFYIAPSLNYTIALVLLAIVALIIINVYIGKAPKMFEAATNSPAPVGDTPAALPT